MSPPAEPRAEPRVEVLYAPDLEAEVSALLLLIGWRQLADDGAAELPEAAPGSPAVTDRPSKASA
jgi:hypothetical protein